MATPSAQRGIRGILAPADRLDRWSLVVLLVLLVTCAVRYAQRHGTEPAGLLVLVGALALALAALTRPLLPDRSWWPSAWVLVMALLWGALTVAAPSFAWCGVPVAFAVLRVLPFWPAVAITGAMTVVVGGGWLRVTDEFDPTIVAGPVGIAIVTVLSYRALQRESQVRQDLLDRLGDAQQELAEAERRGGVLEERTRLSREIHDSVGQQLSSINLLLQAAGQDWAAHPERARAHVGTAAATAREGLDEVRRVVRDLAPAGDAWSSDALAETLRLTAKQTVPAIDVEVRVDGDPRPLPPEIAVALVRTARGALANVREHAAAGRAAVTLTYHADEVLIDVRDDGRGMPTGATPTAGAGTRGHGLRGIRDRAASLGGSADVESAPGDGTTVSVRFPLEAT